MREINFRVWDKGKKEYILDYITGCSVSLNDLFEDERFIFEQYTGIKDKNGVKIYEGDILITKDKNSKYDDKYLVRWKKDGFVCRKTYDAWLDRNVLLDKKDINVYFLSLYYIEIIGNIHEEVNDEDR